MNSREGDRPHRLGVPHQLRPRRARRARSRLPDPQCPVLPRPRDLFTVRRKRQPLDQPACPAENSYFLRFLVGHVVHPHKPVERTRTDREPPTVRRERDRLELLARLVDDGRLARLAVRDVPHSASAVVSRGRQKAAVRAEAPK